MQRRQHPRVRLRLPARLRWSAPLGQRSEPCETINASRGGLLLACQQGHGAGFPLWVTFPFDPEASAAQPEVPARVVRSNAAQDGRAESWAVALEFERAPANHGRSGVGRKNGARNIAL